MCANRMVGRRSRAAGMEETKFTVAYPYSKDHYTSYRRAFQTRKRLARIGWDLEVWPGFGAIEIWDRKWNYSAQRHTGSFRVEGLKVGDQDSKSVEMTRQQGHSEEKRKQHKTVFGHSNTSRCGPAALPGYLIRTIWLGTLSSGVHCELPCSGSGWTNRWQRISNSFYSSSKSAWPWELRLANWMVWRSGT